MTASERQGLAAELASHQGLLGPMDPARPDVWQHRCECGWDDGDDRPGAPERYHLHIADALLARMTAAPTGPDPRTDAAVGR